jgi:hypothetical protein
VSDADELRKQAENARRMAAKSPAQGDASVPNEGAGSFNGQNHSA